MGKMKEYKNIIKTLLESEAKITNSDMPSVKNKLVTDDSSGNFILLTMGWHNKRYKHYVQYHIEVTDNKIWIHQDNTDVGIAYELEKSGIPRSVMVLGFIPDYARDTSGFAIA